jgi:hypothetical protein
LRLRDLLAKTETVERLKVLSQEGLHLGVKTGEEPLVLSVEEFL